MALQASAANGFNLASDVWSLFFIGMVLCVFGGFAPPISGCHASKKQKMFYREKHPFP